MTERIYKSTKSKSEFICNGETNRAYLVCNGEASTNAKVIKEINRIRTGGGTFAEVDFIARQLSKTY